MKKFLTVLLFTSLLPLVSQASIWCKGSPANNTYQILLTNFTKKKAREGQGQTIGKKKTEYAEMYIAFKDGNRIGPIYMYLRGESEDTSVFFSMNNKIRFSVSHSNTRSSFEGLDLPTYPKCGWSNPEHDSRFPFANHWN